MVSNVPAILGAAVSVLCVKFNMPELLMIGRFITGINCGAPAYVCMTVCLSVYLCVASAARSYMQTNFAKDVSSLLVSLQVSEKLDHHGEVMCLIPRL